MDFSDLINIDTKIKSFAVDDTLLYLSCKCSSSPVVEGILSLNRTILPTQIGGFNSSQDTLTYSSFGEQVMTFIDNKITLQSSQYNSLSEAVIRSQIEELMKDQSDQVRGSLLDCLLSAPSNNSVLHAATEYLKSHQVDMPTVFATSEHLVNAYEDNRSAALPNNLPNSQESSQPILSLSSLPSSSVSSSSSPSFWTPSTEQNFQYFLDWMRGGKRSNSSDGLQDDGKREEGVQEGDGNCPNHAPTTSVLHHTNNNNTENNNADGGNRARQLLPRKRTAPTTDSYSNHRLVLSARKKARGTVTMKVFVDEEQKMTKGDFSAISFLADIADHMLVVDGLKAK